jgi:tetratricopeptide (TPR) repeat protein
LNPNTPQWGIDLGRAQLEAGDYVSAETWLRQTVAALPESAAATHLLAHAVKRQRGGAAARPLYERVVTLDGNNAMARYDLGHINYELGDDPAARTHYQRAAALSPDWAEAHYYLGLTTCRLQGAAAALPHFTTATAIAPSWAEARYELAVRVLRTGGPRAAQAHFEMVTELAPSWAEPWRQAGACARLMERWPETTRLFKRAFDLGASERGFLSDLADAACRTRQWPIAVDALRRLQPIAANRLAVDKHLGICLRLVGQLAESAKLLSDCIAANPDWPGARFELGLTLLALGRPREARHEIQRASELQPEWAAPRNVLRDLDDRSNLRLAS